MVVLEGDRIVSVGTTTRIAASAQAIDARIDGPKPTWPNSIVLTTPEEATKAVDAAKTDGADFIKVYSGLSREAPKTSARRIHRPSGGRCTALTPARYYDRAALDALLSEVQAAAALPDFRK